MSVGGEASGPGDQPWAVSEEPDAVVARYSRRAPGDRYSMRRHEVSCAAFERQGAVLDLIRSHTTAPLDDLSVLEVGCGSGGNLLQLIWLGFDPAKLIGNELLDDRAAFARRRLPSETRILGGDATGLNLPQGAFDIVYQSTVFSSLLDPSFQEEVAQRMWRWVRPGGGVLWYDFCYDNPRNPDVVGMPKRRVAALFPEGRMTSRRVTLAPPISRRVVNLSSRMYPVLNAIPALRTHLVCWIAKEA